MATYLATITLGRFDITEEPGTCRSSCRRPARGRRRRSLRWPSCPRSWRTSRSLIGPYPFENAGAIVDHNAGAGYALETQTKPVFDGAPDADDAGARARPPVVRRLGDAQHVAGHLAQRGLRHLRAVAVGRPQRWPGHRRPLPRRVLGPGDQHVLVHAAGRAVRPGGDVLPDPCTRAARWRCTPSRRRSATPCSSRCCASGPPRTGTATSPRPTSRRWPSASPGTTSAPLHDLAVHAAQARVERRSLFVTAPPLRFGIVSTAGINRSLLDAAVATGAAEVVAVSSRDAGRAAAYARQHGIPAFHAGHAGLIADPAVEAVYISAPNALHVEWAMAAIAAGKHVLCEKPLTRSAAAARRDRGRRRCRGRGAGRGVHVPPPPADPAAGGAGAGRGGGGAPLDALGVRLHGRPAGRHPAAARAGRRRAARRRLLLRQRVPSAGRRTRARGGRSGGRADGRRSAVPRPDGVRRRRDGRVRVRHRDAGDQPAGGGRRRAGRCGWTIRGTDGGRASTRTRCSSRTSPARSATAVRRWLPARRSCARPRRWRR